MSALQTKFIVRMNRDNSESRDMTLSTFFGKEQPVMNEREHISFHPPWKESGSKTKNPQLALSALTLLAFLFFLNMLQSCLKDSLQSQAPITIMMTTTTTTTETEAQRQKRSYDEVTAKEGILYDDQNFEDKLVLKDANSYDDPTKVSNSEDISDYNIFYLEDNPTFDNMKKNKKNVEVGTVKTDDIRDSSVLPNWMYDKACCRCQTRHKNTKEKNSEEYLRVGKSLVCEFIDAINFQRKRRNDNKCKN